MKIQLNRPEESRAFLAASSLAFGMLIVLVLATPFVDMSGAVSPEQKVYRLYGYGLLGTLQVALIPVRGWQRSLRIVSAPAGLFIAWCALSVAWSQHFDLTGKRLILLGLVYCSTFTGICDLSAKRSMGIVRILLVVALVLSYVAVIAFPHVGTHIGAGLWRGVMAHKNIAGTLCATTVILFAFDGGKIPLPARAGVIIAALIFFYMSWSKTAWLSLPVALAAGSVAAIIGRRRPTSISTWRKRLQFTSCALFILVLFGLAVATLQQEFFLSLTDDTSTLTTRAAIWRPMIQFYLDHPLLGSGYGAYWDASTNLGDGHVSGAGMWKNVDQGHNGYLDLLVQVGFPGLALALYAAFVRPTGQITIMMSQNRQRAALVVALLVFFQIENMSESSLFADDTLGNEFVLLALAYLQRFAQHSFKKSSADKAHEAVSATRLREHRQKLHRSSGEA